MKVEPRLNLSSLYLSRYKNFTLVYETDIEAFQILTSYEYEIIKHEMIKYEIIK